MWLESGSGKEAHRVLSCLGTVVSKESLDKGERSAQGLCLSEMETVWLRIRQKECKCIFSPN